MSEIQFFYEDTSFILTNPAILSEWVSSAIKKEAFTLTGLNFIFCSDKYLHAINLEYLGHNYYTDIITFDNSEENGKIEGDIFISIDRVKDNAKQQSVTFIDELQRVIIHGVLHLIGYNDKTEAQKKEMREKENAYLSLSKI